MKNLFNRNLSKTYQISLAKTSNTFEKRKNLPIKIYLIQYITNCSLYSARTLFTSTNVPKKYNITSLGELVEVFEPKSIKQLEIIQRLKTYINDGTIFTPEEFENIKVINIRDQIKMIIEEESGKIVSDKSAETIKERLIGLFKDNIKYY